MRVKIRLKSLVAAAAAATSCVLLLAEGAAAQLATPPYTVSVFAKGANGNSSPDSIVQWRDSVLVGFQNGAAADGSDGRSSAIVQYSLTGQVERSFTVTGRNDGLRLVAPDELWALQNEDANPRLVVIDLLSGRQFTFAFPPTAHGGGYDDLAVVNGQVFISASNPNLDANGVNVFPALLRITLQGGQIHLTPVLEGNAEAIDIPSGQTVTLDLTDPDSLAVDELGNVVLDSQQDGELVFVGHPLTPRQTVTRLSLSITGAGPTTVDDTAFAPHRPAFILVSDTPNNQVLRIDRMFGFEAGTPYSASDTAGVVGALNLDTGVLTPVVTGLGSGHGMIFVVPRAVDAERDEIRELAR
jgi:hypothetical protein